MKKLKKILCLCTAILMISSLVSCNSGNENADSSLTDKSAVSLADGDKTSNKGNEITKYYDELSLEGTEEFTKIFKLKYSGDKLYVCGQKNSEKGSSLFSTDLSALQTSQTQKDSNIPDDSEEKDIYKDSKGNIYNCSSGEVKVYDKDLKLIKTIDNDFFKDYDEIKKLYFYSSAVSENGDIYIAASKKTAESIQLIKLDSSFNVQYITSKGDFSDCGQRLLKIFIGSNGNPVLCTSDDCTYINEISPDSGTTVLRYEIPCAEEIVGGCGGYSIIYRNGSTIYGYDYLNDNTSELYSTDASVSQITEAYIRDNLLITEQIDKGNSQDVLSVYDKDGKFEKDISFSGIDQINDIKITSEENVFLLNEHYGLDYTDDGGFETTQPEIIRLKEDGTTETVYKGEKQYSEIHYTFTADSKGNICICSTDVSEDNMIHAVYIDSAGKQTDISYDSQGNIRNAMCINDEIYLQFYSYDTNSMSLFNVNKDTLSIDKISSDIKLPSYELTEGNNGYDLFYSTQNTVHGYHMSDSSSEKIFSWFDTDVESIPAGGILNMSIADSDNIFYVKNAEWHSIYDDIPDTDSDHPLSVIHLKKADESRLKELNSRTVISIAGMYISDEYFSKIKKFNKSNSEYMIMATDYSEYNSFIDDNNSEGLSKMQTDIAQGNIPDILLGDWSLDIQSFLSKNTLVDLNDYLRNDPQIDSSDLAENILDACTYNGKLYCIPLSFNLTTLTVPEECTESKEMLSFDEFFSLSDSFSDRALTDSSRESFFSLLVSSYISENIDFSSATCNFDTDIFRKIMEKSKTCVPESELYSDAYFKENGSTPMSEHLFRENDVRGLNEFYYCLTGSDPEHISNSLKGIPSSSGAASLLGLTSYLCITNVSENKEGAWEFIKYFTSLDGHVDQDPLFCQSMMSVLRSENQKAIESIKSDMSKDNYADYYQSDIDKYTEILNTLCNGKMINNNNYLKLLMIISEQAESFFNDTQSLDETVAAVQSKVNLYLSEIK